MAVTTKVSNHYLVQKAEKKIDILNDSIKAVLMSGEFSFDPDNHSTYSDISGSVLPFTGGHVLKTLTGVSKSIDTVNDRVDYSFDNVAWVASGEFIKSRASVLYDDSIADDTVIGCVDFGEMNTISDGQTLSIESPILRDRGVSN